MLLSRLLPRFGFWILCLFVFAITQTAHAMFYEQRYYDLAGGKTSPDEAR
ncbi:MAG: hypothetical protein QGF18_05935 [Alphaproteobacteria bacterium]|jgi:hypothetical protein|nr:hypothetical protein [Alphaproteobacteria bacterium]MDP7183386.1 hypothetical protein [Alphaproteobacteria bacterium]HJO88587.1 hypothetical protein [Alphaproteobacteria bacterium]|tara:strand:- start:193 stop:342 length:150 start_codon:yes stop_codon:yes gene_type:complete